MARAEIAPRMLTKDQAARYCGISAPVFAEVCPIPSVAMGPDPRLNRYDIKALDAWLDSRSGCRTPSDRPSMAEMMGKANARAD